MSLDALITQVHAEAHGDALARLERACAVAQVLDETADHLVGHFVDQARREGASWTAIGSSMGVTKQAAQQRFTAGHPSLDRFTNRARVVVLKAEHEARDRGHAEATTLHLLLGLLAEWKGLAGRALKASGVTRGAVAKAVAAALPAGGTPRPGPVSASTGLNKAYELAVRESLRLGHGYVGTEHLLLGLLEARDEPGAQVLTGLGVTKPEVEAWTLQALAELRATRPA